MSGVASSTGCNYELRQLCSEQGPGWRQRSGGPGGVSPHLSGQGDAARRGRRRYRIVGLCSVVALALLGASAVPALLARGDGGVEVVVGDE